MKYPIRKLTDAGTALLLGLYLLNPAAVAAEVPGAGKVPLKSMNQAEYEIYRQQLDQQVNSSIPGNTKQNSPAVEKEPAPAAESEPDLKETGSSYGKGYRARMERSGNAGRAGGNRGGAMGRGGGGRNR